MNKLSLNSLITSIYKNDTLQIIHPTKNTIIESMGHVLHIEMHQICLTDLFIITPEKFIFAQYKHNLKVLQNFKLDEYIYKINFVKFVYFNKGKNHQSYAFMLNDKIYTINENKLISHEFENPLVDGFVSMDKTKEYMYLLDDKFNFILFDLIEFKVLKQFNVEEIIFKNIVNINYIKINLEINFLYTEEGVIFLYNNGYTQTYKCVLIKNSVLKFILSDNFIEGKVNFSDCVLKLNEFDSLNLLTNKICSETAKQISYILFSDPFAEKLYVFIYWNKLRKFNIFEIRVNQPYQYAHSIVSNNIIKVGVLLNGSSIYYYNLDYKKTFFKVIIEKSKRINIDNDNIVVNNFFKKTQNTITLKSRIHFNTLESKTINLTHALKSISKYDLNLLKEHMYIYMTKKLTDTKFNEEYEDKIINMLNDKIDSIFSDFEKLIDEEVNIYARSMEKAIYEEQLNSLRLEKLIEYYSKKKY